MNDDNKRKLYDALSEEYDMGSFEQFSADIEDEGKRRKLYDAIKGEYDLPDFAGFTTQLGIGNNPAYDTRESNMARGVDEESVRAAKAGRGRVTGTPGYVPQAGMMPVFDGRGPVAGLPGYGGAREEEEDERLKERGYGFIPGGGFDGRGPVAERPPYTPPAQPRLPEQYRQAQYRQPEFKDPQPPAIDMNGINLYDAAAEKRWRERVFEEPAEKAWRKAEEDTRKLREANVRKIEEASNDEHSTMLGKLAIARTRAAALPTESMAARLKAHDMEKMAEDAWRYLTGYLDPVHMEMLLDGFKKEILLEAAARGGGGEGGTMSPEEAEKALREEAVRRAKARQYQAMFDKAVEANTPKDVLDFLKRKIVEGNSISKLAMAAARVVAGTRGDMEARAVATQKYGEDHRVADIGGSVVQIATDLGTWVSGGVGKAAAQGVATLTRKVAEKSGNEIAKRVATGQGGQLVQRIIGGSGNFAAFEGLGNAVAQLEYGGVYNEETGGYEYSMADMAKAAGHGVLLGGATGVAGGLVGNVGDRVYGRVSSTGGKMAVRGGQTVASIAAEGTVFALPEFMSGEGDWDTWLESVEMMAGFKLHHGVKSIPSTYFKLMRSPESRAGFETRLRSMLDGEPGLALTRDEREELERSGYGDLAALVEGYKRTSRSQREAIERGQPVYLEPDGEGEIPYNRFIELMEDKSVSEAARAKMHYYVSGHKLPQSSIIGTTLTEHVDAAGNVEGYTVEAYGAGRSTIVSRRYKSLREAEVAQDRYNRQAELNWFAMAEAAHDKVHKEMKDGVTAEGVREEVNADYGVDIDKALGKEENRRSEGEKRAIEEYIRRLGEQWVDRKEREERKNGKKDVSLPADRQLPYGTEERGTENDSELGVRPGTPENQPAEDSEAAAGVQNGGGGLRDGVADDGGARGGGGGHAGGAEERLAVELDGDLRGGSQEEQAAWGLQTIERAKAEGLYIDPATLDSFGERYREGTGESVVYLDEANGRVVKVKDPFAKSPMKGNATGDALYEHLVHNQLFPEDGYRLLGVTEVNGGMRLVLEQRYVEGARKATKEEVERYLTGELGLQKEGKYWYGNDLLSITDVDAESDNVIADAEGRLHFIDPIIKLKAPARMVLEAMRGNASVEDRIRQEAEAAAEAEREAYRPMARKDGTVHPVTLNEVGADGKPKEVYLLDGSEVALRADGSIDVEHSSPTLTAYDPEKGENVFLDNPYGDRGIASVGEVLTREDYEARIEANRQRYIQERMEAAQGAAPQQPTEEEGRNGQSGLNNQNAQQAAAVDFTPGARVHVSEHGETAEVVSAEKDGVNVTVRFDDGSESTTTKDMLQMVEEAYRKRLQPTGQQPASQPRPAAEQPQGGGGDDGMAVGGFVATPDGWQGKVVRVGDNGRIAVEGPDGGWYEYDRGELSPTAATGQQAPAEEETPAEEDSRTAAERTYDDIVAKTGGAAGASRKVDVSAKAKADRLAKAEKALREARERANETEYGSREEAKAEEAVAKAEAALEAARADKEAWDEVVRVRNRALAAKAEADAAAERAARERRLAGETAEQKARREAYEAEQARRKEEAEAAERRRQEENARMRAEEEERRKNPQPAAEAPAPAPAATGAGNKSGGRTLSKLEYARMQMADDPAALEILSDTEPKTLEEVAAMLLATGKNGSGVKLNREEFMGHTGYGTRDVRGYAFVLAGKDKGGVSLDEFTQMMLEVADELGIGYDDTDAMVGVNAVLSLFQQVGRQGDINDYIVNNRIAQAEAYHESLMNAIDGAMVAELGVTQDEYAAWVASMEEKAAAVNGMSEEEYYNIFIGDESYGRETERDNGTSGEEGAGALQGQQGEQAAAAADDTGGVGEDEGGAERRPAGERLNEAYAPTEEEYAEIKAYLDGHPGASVGELQRKLRLGYQHATLGKRRWERERGVNAAEAAAPKTGEDKKETAAKTEPQQPNKNVTGGSSLQTGEEEGGTPAEADGEPAVSGGKDTKNISNSKKSGEKKQIKYSPAKRKWQGVPVNIKVFSTGETNRVGEVVGYTDIADILLVYDTYAKRAKVRVVVDDHQAERPDRIVERLESEGVKVDSHSEQGRFVDFDSWEDAVRFEKHVRETEALVHPQPIGRGVFGDIYDQFRGRVKEAFEFLMRHKGGDLLGVFHRDEIGDIDLVWGDKGGGIDHIIDKHVGEGKSFATADEAVSVIEDIINNGEKAFENGDRIVLKTGDKQVTIRKNYREKGKKIADKNWVLTAYDELSADSGSPAATNQDKAGNATDKSRGKDTKNNPNDGKSGEKKSAGGAAAPRGALDFSGWRPAETRRGQREEMIAEGQAAYMDAASRVAAFQLGDSSMERERMSYERFAEAYRERVGDYIYGKDEPLLRGFYEYMERELERAAGERKGGGRPTDQVSAAQKTDSQSDRATGAKKAAQDTAQVSDQVSDQAAAQEWRDGERVVSEDVERKVADFLGKMRRMDEIWKKWVQTEDGASPDYDKAEKEADVAQLVLLEALRGVPEEALAELEGRGDRDLTAVVEIERDRRKEQKELSARFAEGMERQGKIEGKVESRPLAERVDDYTSKDAARAQMNGVYHDEEGYGVATDSHVLVASRGLYDGSRKGKIVATHKVVERYGEKKTYNKGEEIPGRFPAWRNAIPGAEGASRAMVDWDRLLGFLAGVKAAEKGSKEGPVVWLRMPNGDFHSFDPDYLEKFANAAKELGVEELEYTGMGYPFAGRSAEGVTIVMPKMVGEEYKGKEFYYDMAGGNARMQKAEGRPGRPTAKERRLRDAVVLMLRQADLEVVTDEAEGRRVLELANGKVRMHRVYHGSGADFEAFDHSHMGEGEGNQAYGWGTYVTEVEGIGRTYAESYPQNQSSKDAAYSKYSAAKTATLRALRDYQHAESKEEKERAGAEYKRLLAEADRLYDEWMAMDEGRFLYTVEIPDDNGSNYLEWEKPLGEEGASRLRRALEEELLRNDGEGLYKGAEDALREELRQNLQADTSGEKVYGTVRSYLGGDEATSRFLHSAGYAGVKYPANYRGGGNERGDSNYVIFDEGDLRITDKVRFFRTEDGEVYGYTVGGRIYLDLRVATAETPVHEYGHLWAQALRAANPEAWERLKETMRRDTELWSWVKGKYAELENEDDLAEEVFTHFGGRRGAERLRAEQERMERENAEGLVGLARIKAMFHRLSEALRGFWQAARDLFAGNNARLKDMTAEDFADMMLADLAGGFNPRARKDDIRYEKGSRREKTRAEKEVENITEQENGVLYHKAMEMQADFMAKTGGMPLEMGVFTDKHFVIVNNVSEGNISAVRAFDIEKDPGRIAQEIYRLIDNEGDEISDSTRKVIEEARTRLSYGFNYSRNTGERGIGVYDAGVGERQQSERGGDNALDSGTHVEDVRFREEDGEGVFFSNAERAVEGIRQEKANAGQWLAMIQKAGGLKAGEDQWMGLSDWLNERKGQTLTKAEVLEYIRANMIEVEEVEYGEDAYSLQEYSDYASIYVRQHIDNFDEHSDDFDEEDFHQYMYSRFPELKQKVERGEILEGLFNYHYPNRRPIHETRLKYTTEGLDNKREIALTVPTIESWNEFDNIHFGDAGDGRAVAWVRFGETTDEQGNRVLVIDEIQSKRHQEGRKKGYEDTNVKEINSLWRKIRQGDRIVLTEAEKERIEELMAEPLEAGKYHILPRVTWLKIEKDDRGYHTFFGGKRYSTTDAFSEFDASYILNEIIFEEVDFHNRGLAFIHSVPAAPFEKNWHEVAMKRMLRYAAENGYDRVAWTTGEQQAERYDLGGAVKSISSKTQDTSSGTKEMPVGHKGITIDMKNGQMLAFGVDEQGVVVAGEYKGRHLSEIVGNEMAKRLMEEDATLEGEGLRIGGEGMKGFYDQILPRFMDKYGKRWGVKTEDVSLPEVGDGGLTMHSVAVTEEMRESVMQGQPLFRNLDGESDAVVENMEPGTRPLTDREKVARLEAGPKVRVYRSMQLIDGKLYPPMSAKSGGQMREASEIGVWEEADEHPELADDNGKFTLNKGNGKSLKAAYNPYIHTSRTMLNDQFSEAQSRPNLVVVEVEVPESELDGRYRAAKAKDSVGAKQWKAGVVQGQLSGTREVILSRWAKPVRIVPDAEVARNIYEQIKGQVRTMPSNVVTPQVRAELERLGVEFVETDNTGRITEGEHRGETWASVYGKRAARGREGDEGGGPGSRLADIREMSFKAADGPGRAVVVDMDMSDGSEYRVVVEADPESGTVGEIISMKATYKGDGNGDVDWTGQNVRDLFGDMMAERILGAKEEVYMEHPIDYYYEGNWYGSGSVERIGAFVGYSRRRIDAMHERQERSARRRFEEMAERLHLKDRIEFADTIDDVEGLTERQRAARRRKKGWYDTRTGRIVVVLGNHRSMDDVMRTILHEGVAHHGLRQLFGKDFDTFLDNVYAAADAPIRARIVELSKRHGWNARTATEEYLATLAEDTNFEQPETQSWWRRVKAWFYDMLHKLGVKFADFYGTLTDNELRYILWRSYENLREPGRFKGFRSVVAEAEDVVKQSGLKVGDYARWDVAWTVKAYDERTYERELARVAAVHEGGVEPEEARRLYDEAMREMRGEKPWERDYAVHAARADFYRPFAEESEAQSRPNHVVVEEEVPESELDGTYRAAKAKHPYALVLVKNKGMYVTYGKDARKMADMFGLVVVRDSEGKEKVGFMKQDIDEFLPQLIRSGQRVAVAEAAEGVAEGTVDAGEESEQDNREVNIVGAEKEHGFANFGEARKWAKENIVGEYENPEIGSVNISGAAIEKYLSEKAVSKSDNRDVHLSALKVMPSIIENSIVGEVHADNKGNSNIKDIVRLYGCINIDGRLHRVKTTVKRYVDENAKSKAYSYEVTEIELLEGFSGTPHTLSADSVPTSNNSISAAKLLKNFENPQVLSEESSYEADREGGGNREENIPRPNGHPSQEGTDGVLFRDEEESIEDLAEDRSMGMAERFTAIAARLAEENAGSVEARNSAHRAVSDNLTRLRSTLAKMNEAARLQKRYDKGTVKRVTDLARVMVSAGYLNGAGKADMKGLLTAIRESTGNEDNRANVDRIMDIMVDNQLRNLKEALHGLEAVRGSRVDARGVNVQGRLDTAGQEIVRVFKENKGEQRETIEQRIADAEDRMGGEDSALADAAANEKAGLELALDYVERVRQSEAEEKDMRAKMREIAGRIYTYERVADVDAEGNAVLNRDGTERTHEVRRLKPEYKGAMTEENRRERERVEQTLAAMEEAIRHMRMERVDSYTEFIGRLSGSMRESMSRAAAWKEQEKRRVAEIHHNANSDMQGRPADEHRSGDKNVLNWINNTAGGSLFAPLASFGEMLKMFGRKSPNGEGYLYNRFLRGFIDVRQKETRGVHEKYAKLDKKASEVFGEGVDTWAKMMNEVRKHGKKIEVEWWDGKVRKPHELHQGNLMYIYMVNKMADGRMKLRHMGVTEEAMTAIEEALDPRLKEIADWLQEEFLVESRNEYNETHKRIFGASMAAIEDYFPLVINSGSRSKDAEKEDAAQDNANTITTITGAIKRRTVNVVDLDLLNADALHVILDHVAQMEHWNAFAEYNRDLNTLRSYKRFENQVRNMTAVLGDGDQTWRAFNKTAQIAVGSYQKSQSDLDAKSLEFASKVTAAKVAFRINTALKQLLSLPAYLPYVNVKGFARSVASNMTNKETSFKWCMENLPIFRERWESRVSGDPRLMKLSDDWKSRRATWLQRVARWGMLPNAAIDALTVSIGAHAVYETRRAQYLKEGYSEEAAERRAIQDAEIAYNETQQSSEGGFVSVMQVDKSWLNVLFTIFRNASMAYQRQLHEALRNLVNMRSRARREEAKEFLAKQMMREGVDEAQARIAVEKRFNRAMRKNWIAVATFGYIVQFAWNFGGQMWYLMFGDDDDKKKKTWEDIFIHSLFGGLEGLMGGDILSEAGRQLVTGDRNARSLEKDMPLTSDLFNIIEEFSTDKELKALNDLVNLVVQAGLGANPQTLTDAVVATVDASNGDLGLAREAGLWAMRFIQVPQSQTEHIYFDEIGMSGGEARKLTFDQLVERYAKYRVGRDYPYTPWAWGDKVLIEKGRKRGERIVGERIAGKDEETLARMYEGGGEIRKLIGSATAKRLGEEYGESGARDSYGSGNAVKKESGRAYAAHRDYVDMAEDITLNLEIQKAEEEGDEERLESLRGVKKRIEKGRKRFSADESEESKEFMEEEMSYIRRIRRAALNGEDWGEVEYYPEEQEGR